MLRLQISPSQGTPFELPVDRDEMVIGRSMSSDVAINDRFLSRHQARLRRAGEAWLIEDLGSRNGTFVNGVRVDAPSTVKPGDTITMSASVIRVFEDGAPRPTARPLHHLPEPSLLRPASELLSMSTALPSAVEDPTGASVRRQAERLRILNEVHQALAESISLDELLDLILDRVFDHLRPEKGAIYLTAATGALFRAAERPVGLTDDQFTLSTSLCREVIDKGMAALVHDIEADARFAGAASLLDSGVHSLAAAPLIHAAGTLGMIVLTSSARHRVFSEDDLELLTSLASVAALRIRNVALTEEAAERRRLQEEVALARQIQLSLIPDRLPEVPGWELYGGNVPSRGVSGDYFEVMERLDGRECVLFIADVSGKGIAASLLTAYIEALSSPPIEDGLSPEEVFARVSRRLYRRTPLERFATALLVVLDPAAARIRFANAGHNPALLLRADGSTDRLAATGMPLGLMPAAEYSSEELAMQPGDLLVLYTDGIVEAIDPDEQEYDIARLEELCRRLAADPLAAIADALERELAAFVRGVPFADDRTLVMLRRAP
jgi:serine phosphatase RsbU (regulator of sigma subunit)